MNFNEVHEVLVDAVDLTCNGVEAIVPFIWGPPGVGKSACLLSVAKYMARKLGLRGVLQLGEFPEDGYKWSDYFGFFDCRLSQADAVEVGGFPDKDEARNVMVRTLAAWFPAMDRKDVPEYGILFLDEWNSAVPSVQAASYQIASELRLGEKHMKHNWMVCGAGNRMTDGGVTFKQPLPLANRVCHFDFESDFETFKRWGQTTNEIPSWITAFLEFRPDLLNTFEEHVTKKLPGGAFATERTWHRLGKVSAGLGDNNHKAIRRFARAYLGEGVAREAIAFREDWESLPDMADVLANPDKARLPVGKSVCYATCGALAHIVTPETMGSLITYVSRFEERAFITLCVQDAVRRNDKLAATKAFSDFASEWTQNLL